MPPRQSVGSAPAPELTATVALRQTIQHLQESLDSTIVGLSRAVTPDTVHKTRTASRRLRAVLCAFKRALNRTVFRRYAAALEELAHHLEAVREADVTQHFIASYSQENRLRSAIAQSRSQAVCDLEFTMGTDS